MKDGWGWQRGSCGDYVVDLVSDRIAEIDAQIREALITAPRPDRRRRNWFERTWEALTDVQRETLVRATMSTRPVVATSPTVRRLNDEDLLKERAATDRGRELVAWARENDELRPWFVRARVAPDGYTYVGPTDTEINEYLCKHNGRWPTQHRVQCDRCEYRMWGAGGAIGRHRQICPGHPVQ